MRTFITCAILTAATFTINPSAIQAQPVNTAKLIDSWYHRYLGRHADPIGMSDHLRAIRHGTPLEVVEASILASPEYYARSGKTAEGYIAALHRDVLGRRAGVHEFNHEVRYLLTHGRHAVALRVLSERRSVVLAPPPAVVVQPAPMVVPQPVIVQPAYRPYGSLYVSPRPGISIRVGIR